MALAKADRPKAKYCMGMSSIPVFEADKASGVTFHKGDVVIFTSGLAVEGADSPGSGTVVGIAAEDAINGNTIVAVWPAIPNIVFSGHVATGAAGATVDSAAAHRMVHYGLALNDTHWYINIADVTTECVMIIRLIDAAATAWGEVEFVFTDSVWTRTAA